VILKHESEMKKSTLLLCALLICATGFSQVKSNEKLTYAASYNMSGLMTQLAQVTMQTEMVNTSKKSFLHLSLEAATFSKWDKFFKIRDLYEVYVDPIALKPSLYKRNIYEGGYTKIEKYIFSPDGKSINSTTRYKNGNETRNSVKIGSSTFDVVSIIYKLRTVDFSRLKPGQMASFILVFDEKEYPVYIKYMGMEAVLAGNLGKKRCYKISISAKTNKLKGVDKNLIWLTADSKKIPVLVRFSIPVGIGQLSLIKASGI
jgi:hypothetical protein